MDFESLKMTAFINGLSLLKLPLLAFISPQVVTLTPEKTEIKVRSGWRVRNHLGSVYFGALAMGAELSIALKAIQEIQRSGRKIDFIFKDFKAEFLRRGDGDVHFTCDEAAGVTALIQAAAESADRQERTFKGYATVPSKSADPIMTYELTLSVKRRK